MKNRFFILFLILLFTKYSFSQINFTRDKSISVYNDSMQLTNAWNGGVNSAQFSEIDINLDGVKDLILFDRSGNRISPYININGNFVFSPEYRDQFPDSVESWIILEDYNCDGKNDIFTYANGCISV